jgi:UDP-N-acetylglucosamine--N-acetylmuramyl-(pentapeptide) pyrophosphoryl-undecaprenol N-acetylglucosamine transferase
LNKIIEKDYQLIWQTGKTDYQNILSETETKQHRNIHISEFIQSMELAYSAADIIVSRAGAIAISELAVAKKPVLLVPFPFAAEDHQTKNAMTLVEKNAARMVKDTEMKEKFWSYTHGNLRKRKPEERNVCKPGFLRETQRSAGNCN